MSETAVADTPGFEVLENVSGKAPELDRSPEGNGSGLRTDVGHSFGEEGRNIVVSETTVRGHSLELEIEGELDYDEIEDTHLSVPNSKDGDKGHQEKTQQAPPRISWNEWAGNGDSQEAKPITEEQPINEQQEHRRPREDYKHRRENSKRNSSRRYRESTGGRPRSPPASNYRRPVFQNSGRRTGENESRSGGGGGNTGLRIPPGMSHQHHHHHHGKFSSVSQFQDSEGPNHHPVERGMPPGLGISRNPGPGNHLPPMENRGGHQWRTGPRFQQRSPPPGPRLDDRPPPRRDYVHPERIQQGRIPRLASHRSPPPSEGVPSNNRRTRSPGRGPGPLSYAERSFLARTSDRGRPPARHGGHLRRNSGSPRLPNRVHASPRRVTLPANSVKVRGPSSAGMGQYQRSKNQNPHVLVHRRPLSPVELRRSQFPEQSPFRRPRTRQKQSPPSRRPPEYLDRPDRRSRGRNHHRSPSPGRSNKRQRANSQDRRFGPRAPPPHHPLEQNSAPPHLTQSHSVADGRVRTPLHHPEMDCIWHYVDPQGNTQGPCTIQQFRSWLKTLAEDPQFVDEHKQFRGVSVWKEGMHEQYLMTELLDRNVG